jgi:predicted anti-sigma-YlaC factor YlaD
MNPLQPTCRELVELVDDHLEGVLDDAVRAGLEAHLAECEDCTEYVRQVERTIQLAGRLRTDDLPRALREALLSSARESL